MNVLQVLEQIRSARWERLKDVIDEPDKITMTRNVFDELMKSCTIQIHTDNMGEDIKCKLYGMEVEVIDNAEGFFSIGGKMEGVV